MNESPFLQMLARMHNADLYVLGIVLAGASQGTDVTQKWVRMYTHWSPDEIARSCDRLATWGLVERAGRYSLRPSRLSKSIWFETDSAASGVSSSSGGLNNESIEYLKQQLLLQSPLPAESKVPVGGGDGQTTPLAAESGDDCGKPVDKLWITLSSRFPVKKDAALACFKAALADGATADLLERDILLWAAYCRGRYGKGISHPGMFIARKLEEGERAPRPLCDDLLRAEGTWGDNPDLMRVGELDELLEPKHEDEEAKP